MTSLPIFTALNVPSVQSLPSSTCLQWSGDGQAIFVTKTAIHILTPDPGINFDTTSVLRAPIGKDDRPLGWFRTMVEFNKGDNYHWPEDSQEWAAVSLGSLDVTLRAVVCSPSNLTSEAGCVLAALNSNMELTLWIPDKNHLRGEWFKTANITENLRAQYIAAAQGSDVTTSLQAQLLSIAWSPQSDFGIMPAPPVDGSLLVSGNRAGSLIFFRFNRESGSADVVETLHVSDKWVTHLAFSQWSPCKSGGFQAHLAYGASNGLVGLVKVTQTLKKSALNPAFGESWETDVVLDHLEGKPSAPDSRGITSLEWISVPSHGNVLVHSKAATLFLWSASTESPWHGLRPLMLRPQRISRGSSPLNPVSGIVFVARQDALVVTLFDGSIHVIHNMATNPSFDPPGPSEESEDMVVEPTLTSEKLSAKCREIFVQVEQKRPTRDDMNRISGMMSYDGSSAFMWVHESCRPSDFSYKHDARHSSMFMMAQLWDDSSDEALLEDVTTLLNESKITTGSAPIHRLRAIFLQLRKPGTLGRVHQRLLEATRPTTLMHPPNTLTPYEGELSLALRSEFRSSLTRDLFGWNDVLSLRMRLSIADICWKLSEDALKQSQCGAVAQFLLNSISHRVLRTIIRHLSAIIGLLTPNDVPFVLRMVVQSLLPGSPLDLTDEAQKLSVTVNTQVVVADGAAPPVGNGLHEACPACAVDVLLQDIISAVCSNGHAWGRCSITSFILATPMVRTCIGCSRKAFLPISQKKNADDPTWLPVAAQSWVVEELLEAVHRCLFCGNRFVSII